MKFIKLSGIYAIVNIFNDKYYIGSSVDIRKRWELHKWQLNNNKHDNKYLSQSWIKYNQLAFMFVVLECCEKEKLIEREQFWIDRLEPSYNLCLIAGNRLGFKHSPETCAKISTSQMGKKLTNEHKLKLSKAKIGNKLSNQHKENLSKALKGRQGKIPSKVIRLKMSKAHKDISKWPCPDGWKCKCKDCKEKRNVIRRKITTEFIMVSNVA